MNNQRNETVTALQLGLCSLIYEKLNGDIKTTTGTLNGAYIPFDKQPKGVSNSQKLQKEWPAGVGHHITYFDTDANDWRCFWQDNLRTLKVL